MTGRAGTSGRAGEEPASMAVVDVDGRAVLAVTGALDLRSATEFRRLVTDLVVEARVHLVVDLSGAEFVDSVGLGALVSAHRRTRGLGGGLTIVSASDPVLRLFGLTGLDRVFRVVATREQALDSGRETADQPHS